MSDPVLTLLPLQELQPNPLQPREKIKREDLLELIHSIQHHGVLEPILVAQTPAGYQIIAGERRWRAAKEAGLQHVPVMIKKTTPKGMLEMAIVENVQRVDLSAIERAQAFQQLVREYKYTYEEIAERLGKTEGYVGNTMRLLHLPDAIKDSVISGEISEGHARALVGIQDEKSMMQCYKAVLRENATVRRTEELARKFKEANEQPVKTAQSRQRVQDDQVQVWQKELTSAFSQRTKVQMARSARQTKVTFIFRGSVEETQKELNLILSLTKKAA